MWLATGKENPLSLAVNLPCYEISLALDSAFFPVLRDFFFRHSLVLHWDFCRALEGTHRKKVVK